jgi:Uma2 family endonuclease
MTIEVAIDLNRSYTAEEFEALPYDGHEYELINGQPKEMSAPSTRHGKITAKLVISLGIFMEKNPLGEILTGSATVLNSKSAPRPDVAFIREKRMAGTDYDTAFPGAPDLAVEVISPSDIWFEIQDKIGEYLQAGVQLVWLIDPRSKLVFAYHPGDLKPLTLDVNDELDGEDVIPGFKLKVSELFK